MKLRAITLENVRKFAGQRAELSGIGDGINLISEANETGKSTFFDALHALMFTKYNATGKEVRSLRPASGGAVRVRAQIELPEGLFTFEKSFASQQRAVVRGGDGQVIAQDDEAERWAAHLLGTGIAGPAGLLWVRQGVTGLETGVKSENAQSHETRKTLLSSVAGEIDMVTGGRRMDRVIASAQSAFDALATATGRPRANGPWAEAITEADRLGALRDGLASEVAGLRDALDRRTAVARQLADLSDAERQDARARSLAQAEEAFAQAQAHAARVEAARKDATLAALQRDAAQGALDGLLERQRSSTETAATLDAAEGAQTAAQAVLDQAQGRADAAQRHATEARRSADALRAAQARAGQHALHAELRKSLEGAQARVVEAETQRVAAERARAALAPMRVTPAVLEGIERAAQAAQRVQAGQAGASIVVHYSGAARITHDGNALPEGRHALSGPVRFDLPGIGTLDLDPGEDEAAPDQARAQSAFAAALAEADMPDLDTARAAGRTREDAERAMALAQGRLTVLAPDGLDPLRAEVARIEDELARLGTPQEADAAPADPETLAQAVRDEAQTAADLEEANAVLNGARLAHERARIGLEDATRDHAAARAAIGAQEEAAEAERSASRTLAQAQALCAERDGALDEVIAQAPDHDTIAAELARARGAVEAAQEETARLRQERSELDGRIRSKADDGLEERLEETRARAETAEARAARFAREAAALRRLLDTLAQTRGAAQEAYFGPIQAELAPLLAILHEDAALSFDPATLLPTGMQRGDTPEALTQLSGGTQEQIAVLTRLAFARLFARQGTPVPVILDDALVYSDDDRIERMFTALHRVALDQQVIVFTCRQRAFAGLGGARPQLTVAPID
ncbi:AAA family ATPase [Sulfitobacter albidus]|uniref:AAA family ATPase n=1 Tax=Sulfitobacter albidus TaxID=2829501 RepID=A0A975JEW1_9RHOB|nr:ATP-binding protein [Sulfitobacter albidus]QUJ77229.1 AAA family ATPase [Sulfitobacter albidus]